MAEEVQAEDDLEKSGRVNVASKVFDTKREATAWLARERAALAGGVDPRAGKERVRDAVQRWLVIRSTTVAQKSYRADQDVERLTTASVLNLHLSAVSGREVARVFEHLLASGLVESSVVRYRASLSSFFGWCVREKLIATNPVTAVPVPRSSEERTEMNPFTEDELETAYRAWRVGHASIATTNLYLHHLGTGADLAGLERLNRAPGATGGAIRRTHRRVTTTNPRVIRAFPQATRGLQSVELRGFEPLTFSLRTRRATNCATAPCAREREGKVTTALPVARIGPVGQAPATRRCSADSSTACAASADSAASRASAESDSS